MQPLYDRDAVRPMWEELSQCGVTPLTTAADVDAAIAKPGTTMVVVNSICGCAAGGARPGVTKALQNAVIPDHLTTVFAGVDMEAVARARELMPTIRPSSPSVAIFKDGEVIYSLERRQIERMRAPEIAAELVRAFNEHCSHQGPSVPTDAFEKVQHVKQCGSTIPTFQG